MMAIMEISVVPVGTGSPSVSQHIARVIRVLEAEKNLRYELTAMGTIIEGDLDVLLNLVKRMHESAFNEEVERVVTTIKIDDRSDKPLSIDEKLNSLINKSGQSDEYFGGNAWW